MIVFLQFIVLGLLQGLTEFLPISSSGHLVLFGRLFGVEETLFVSIVLHVATLLSICVVMRKDIVNLIKRPFSQEGKRLILSTIITFVIALLLYDIAKNSYFEGFLPFSFMITACFLILTDLFRPKIKCKELNRKQSIIMGIAQGIAVFPGISRSGATICAGLFAGGERGKVARHSFLMSVPIIIASLVMEIVELATTNTAISTPIVPLIFAFIVAFVIGAVSLKFMINLTCKVKFRYFAYYLIILSVISMFI